MTTLKYELSTTLGVRKCPEHKSWVPSIPKCYDFKSGDYVQLRFTEPGKSESMWVEITTVQGLGAELVGRLDNDPHFLETVKSGDMVAFTPLNIFNFLTPEGKRWRDTPVPTH